MRRALLALALVAAACGGKQGQGTETPAGGGDSPAPLLKQAIVSFGTEPQTDRTRAWVVITDETGSATSFPLDDVPATECAPQAGGDLDAIGSLRCAKPELRVIVVARHGQFIVLDQHLDAATGEPAEYEEQRRVPIPEGAKVSFQP